jgi:hypothetical protein
MIMTLEDVSDHELIEYHTHKWSDSMTTRHRRSRHATPNDLHGQPTVDPEF